MAQADRRSRRRLRLAALVFLALLTGWVALLVDWHRPDLPEEKHIAVLEFHPTSSEVDEYAAGLAGYSTKALAAMKRRGASWSVISAPELREREASTARDAWRRCGANLVVTGTVSGRPEDLEIGIMLMEPRTQKRLRSRQFRAPRNERGRLTRLLQEELSELLDLPEPAAEAAVARDGEAVDAYLRGLGALRKGRDGGAMFEAAIGREPRFAAAHLGLAESLLLRFTTTGEPSALAEAKQAIEVATGVDGQASLPYQLAGRLYSVMKEPRAALAAYERAMALDPTDGETLRLAGRAAAALGDAAKAERYFRAAVDREPNNAAGYDDLGEFLIGRSRFSEAEPILRRQTTLAPDYGRAWLHLGRSEALLNRFEEAERAFERAIELDPSPENWAARGEAQLLHANYQAALDSFDKALAKRPKDHRLFGARAEVLSRLGRPEAKAEFEKALALASASSEVDDRAAAAIYLAHLGAVAESRAAIAGLVKNAPRRARVLLAAAEVEEVLNNREAALRWLTQALEAGADAPSILAEPQFTDLRQDPRFQSLIARAAR